MNIPLQTIRRTASEILASSICKLFPEALLISGDINELGFFYDFAIPQPIDDQLIPLIEEGMRTQIKNGQQVRILDMMPKNAAEFFNHHEQPIKADIVSDVTENIIPIFQLGDFHDYAPGKHVENAKDVGTIKILEINLIDPDEDPPIYRIQGTAFHDQKDLKKFLKRKDAYKNKDHLILGKEMELYGIQSEVSDLDLFWYPKGEIIKEILFDLWRKENKTLGFQTVATPRLCKENYLQTTNYGNLFYLEDEEYVLSPSPQLAHASLFQLKKRAQVELPIRLAESAPVYRDFSESQLCGLLRTRAYTADLATIFCSQDQVDQEMISSLQLIHKISKILGFEHHWCFVAQGQKPKGARKKWESIRDRMVNALEACGLPYITDDQKESPTGPRIEVRLIDALGREWCGPYVEVDCSIPEQFRLHYQGADGSMHQPVMITRSMFGSLERLIAILVEHYAGQFPLWMAPEQVRVMTIGGQSKGYAESVFRTIQEAGYRVSFDQSDTALGAKVHAVEREKVPYAIIIGNKEEKEKKVAVRPCGVDGKTEQMTIGSFLEKLQIEVRTTG